MKYFRNIILIVFASLYLLNKSLQSFGLIQNPFIKNHLNDLLCMPLVLFLTRWIITRFKPFREVKEIPILAVLLLTIYWSVYFEFYLPSKSSIYTGDIVDVAMYFIGSGTFIFFQKLSFDTKYSAIESLDVDANK